MTHTARNLFFASLLSVACAAPQVEAPVVDSDAGVEDDKILGGGASCYTAVGKLLRDGTRVCTVVRTGNAILTTAHHCTNKNGDYTAVFRTRNGTNRSVEITHRRLLSTVDAAQLQFTGRLDGIGTLPVAGDAAIGSNVTAVGYSTGSRESHSFKVVSESTGATVGGYRFDPNTQRAVHSSEGAICNGDSGGAAIAGGQMVGLLTPTAGCSAGNRGVFVRASALSGWSRWFTL